MISGEASVSAMKPSFAPLTSGPPACAKAPDGKPVWTAETSAVVAATPPNFRKPRRSTPAAASSIPFSLSSMRPNPPMQLIEDNKKAAPDRPIERDRVAALPDLHARSEEHTSELQSLMRTSYAVFCLKKKNTTKN